MNNVLNNAVAKPHPGIKAQTAQTFAQWAIRFGQWVVIPVLLLPMLSAISEGGWRGFSAVGSKAKHWLFWIEAPLLLLLTVRIPFILLAWIPHVQGFRLQAASFAARASLAYLLFGAGYGSCSAFVQFGRAIIRVSPNRAPPIRRDSRTRLETIAPACA